MRKSVDKSGSKAESSSQKPAVSGAGAGSVVSSDVNAFLQVASQTKREKSGRGGLVFALDATMSRQQTWDQAQHIQAQMFTAVDQTGGLDVQLVYFRGMSECRASKWVGNGTALRDLMTGISCRGGQTQISKVLSHTLKEATKRHPVNPDRSRVDALVFVGDAMEENVDLLCDKAGRLGLVGVPCFLFQEGDDRTTERAFREMARLSRGAYMRFGSGSAAELAELLKAVARFVSGGHRALENEGTRASRLLLEQLK